MKQKFVLFFFIPFIIFPSDQLLERYPLPIFSIGQKILPKNELILGTFIAHIDRNHSTISGGGIVGYYGLLEHLSVTVFLPYFSKHTLFKARSAGILDLDVQFEYEFFVYDRLNATVIGGISFPTANKNNFPPTGLATYGFTFGGTAAYIDPEWYAFTTATVTTRKKRKDNVTFGKDLNTELALGRNIINRPNGSFGLLIEFLGDYFGAENSLLGDKGRMIFLCGPSFIGYYKNLRFQSRLLYPVGQRVFDDPRVTTNYRIAFGIAGDFDLN